MQTQPVRAEEVRKARESAQLDAGAGMLQI
jgi:hypothetical protein